VLNKNNAGFTYAKKVKSTLARHDTVIHEFTLQGATAGVWANRKRYASFIGRPLPAFVLSDTAGRPLESKSLRGQAVVLNLWFTACAPCVAEMPALNRIQADPANAAVVFLALTYESGEKVRAFLQKRAFTFRQLVGAQAYCNQFTSSYPLSIFVDRDGVVRDMVEGMPPLPGGTGSKGVDDRDFVAALQLIK
jgi:peroxiredoxin